MLLHAYKKSHGCERNSQNDDTTNTVSQISFSILDVALSAGELLIPVG